MGAVDSRFVPCVVKEASPRTTKRAMAPNSDEQEDSKRVQVVASPICIVKATKHVPNDEGSTSPQGVPPAPCAQATHTHAYFAGTERSRPGLNRSMSERPSDDQLSPPQQNFAALRSFDKQGSSEGCEVGWDASGASMKKSSSMHSFSILANGGTEVRRKKGILKKPSSERLEATSSSSSDANNRPEQSGEIGLAAHSGSQLRAVQSSPNLAGLAQDGMPGIPRRGIRFSATQTMVKIDSHTDLSAMERDAIYYERSDMTNFVRSELMRRKVKGITSTSALAPEAESAGELDDEDDIVAF